MQEIVSAEGGISTEEEACYDKEEEKEEEEGEMGKSLPCSSKCKSSVIYSYSSLCKGKYYKILQHASQMKHTIAKDEVNDKIVITNYSAIKLSLGTANLSFRQEVCQVVKDKKSCNISNYQKKRNRIYFLGDCFSEGCDFCFCKSNSHTLVTDNDIVLVFLRINHT